MKWEKPTTQILDTFEKIVPQITGIERRKMFGLPVAFINSNLYMGVHQDNIMLRLSERDRKDFLKIEGAHQFEPTPGRPMKEYVVLPHWMFEETNKNILDDWIYKSFEYVSALPPKEKKKK